MLKKSRVTKADKLRSWGLPYPSFKWDHLRYKNPPEKGAYWWHFSRFIRQRDVEQYETCISCGRAITVDTCDAGHFMPAANCGRDLLFDERNVNAECYSCNAFDETHLLGYTEGLDKRYGEGTAARLRQRRQEYKDGPPIKDWKAKEYEEKIKQLPSYES